MRRQAFTRSYFKPISASFVTFSLAISGVVAEENTNAAVAQSATVLANDFDYYADFSGAQSLVADAADQVIPASGAYTVEAWINPRAHSGSDVYKTVVSQNQNAGGRDNDRHFLSLQWIPSTSTPVQAGRYVIHVGFGANDTANDYNYEVGDGVPIGSWSHIALSSNGTNTTVFFNGRILATISNVAHGAGINAAPFTIGATGGTPTHFFNGGIDQVKVWGAALTDAQIRESMHSWSNTNVTGTPSLIAHWDFNDRTFSESKVFDKSDTTTDGFHLDMKGTVDFKDVKSVIEATGRQIFTFPRTYITQHGGWRVPAGTTRVDALLVGGGGSGGSDGGGGGGGGEINQATSQTVTAGSYLAVVVGQGGLAGAISGRVGADGSGGLAGQTSAIAVNGAVVLSANGGQGGHKWRSNNITAPDRANGGTGGTGGSRTDGAKGGLGALTCPSDGDNVIVDANASGQEGSLASINGEIYGSGGGGGIAITDNVTVKTTANKGGTGAGNGSVIEATGDASTGFSGLANRGGGGGGSAACGSAGYANSRADGGNGGSGVVVVSVPMEAKCFFESGGWLASQTPKIRIRPLIGNRPIVNVVTDLSVTAFYGKSAKVGDKLYAVDRGRNQLRSILPTRAAANATGIEVLGTVNAASLGVASDGRYVYAMGSDGIARYDTQTGVFQQSFIGRGDLPAYGGEIAFARFNGIGYLFIAAGNSGVNTLDSAKVYAVPVTGTIPSQINKTTHLFSRSAVAADANDRANAISGLAIIGNQVYFSEFTQDSTGRVYRKEVQFNVDGTINLTNQIADGFITNLPWMRSLAADASSLYIVSSTSIFRYSGTTVDRLNSSAETTANGLLATADCNFAPRNVIATVNATKDLTVWFDSFWTPTVNTIPVNYRIEYRNNGGPWTVLNSAQTVSPHTPLVFGPRTLPLSGEVEVRVATFAFSQFSQFSYAPSITVAPVTPPPLCADPMKLEFEVPANTAVTIPFGQSGTSGTVSVRWGDGNDAVPITWSTGIRTLTNTYITAGTYVAQICGQFTTLNGSNSQSMPHLTKVLSWGELADDLTSLAYAFNGAAKLVDVPNTLPAGVTNLLGAFTGATIFNDSDVAAWNTANVTNFAQVFNKASSFNQNLGTWNTGNGLTFESMFRDAAKFNNAGSDTIKNWDTADVTSFTATFSGATVFNQPIGSWNTSAAIRFDAMFFNAAAFNQPVGDWVTNNVTSMSAMFYGATSFNQPIATDGSKWDVSKVTNFGNMFNGALSFNQPIGTWNTSSATLMEYMFFDARVFNQPLATNGSIWDVSKATRMTGMFGKARAFNQDLSTWVPSSATDMSAMFSTATSFNNGNAASGTLSWNTSKVTNMNHMFNQATSFKRVIDFQIDVLTTAIGMLDYSGMTDDQYGSTISGFQDQYAANGAQAGVLLGAVDKTALCNTPHADVLYLTASPRNWVITDKTDRTAGFCTPQVTITAKSGSHVYGNPVPSIGFDVAVTNGSLPTSDWLNEVACRAVAVSGGAAVTTTSAAAVVSTKSGDVVSGTYKTVCSGPSGTGLGINVTYKDNVYAIAKRPITVIAKNRVAVIGQSRITLGDVSSNALETESYMITSGTIASGDTLTFTLSNTASVDGETKYTTAGTTDIAIAAKNSSPTTNYEVTAVSGSLTISAQTYVFAAKSLRKVYGEIASFDSASGFLCETNSQVRSCETEVAGKIVNFSSGGAARYAAVGTHPLVIEVIPGPGDGTTYQYVNGGNNGGIIEVVKRKLTVTPTAITLSYGDEVPTYSFNITGFADGEGVGNLPGNYAPTCVSAYTDETPRGTVLAITCSGGNAGDNYFFDYASSNLTVRSLSNVSPDVPQSIMLAEEEFEDNVQFSFALSPVNEICFANLVILSGDSEPLTQRVRVVPGQSAVFESTLPIGEYTYDLRVDGNCDIADTSGAFAIQEYVAPPEQPAAAPVPVVGPSISSVLPRQVPANTAMSVTVQGQQLAMVTEVTVGGVSVPFTIDALGVIKLQLPALRPGTYDMIVYHTYGSLTYPAAFTIGGSTTPVTGGGSVGEPKLKSRTLRFTNFAGDGFRLPTAARNGITRVFTAIGDVDRVVCRGLTSGRVQTSADKRLAERRAQEACTLARRLAPEASIELRISPAAGIGPRFRAVNMFIVYGLD